MPGMKPPTLPGGIDPDHGKAITDAFIAATDSTVEIKGPTALAFPAGLIRWLLLEASPPAGTKLSRIRFRDVQITGMLDLAATTLTLCPHFRDCSFIPDEKNAGINLTDATGISIEILGGNLWILEANRLKLSGSLILRSAAIETMDPPPSGGQLTIEHGVLLCGATIHGNLDLRGTKVFGPLPSLSPKAEDAPDPEPIAILADGLSVDGNLLFCSGACATGEVRINGAQIQRDLNCSGTTLKNPGGFSLSAAGAVIHGTFYFNPVFKEGRQKAGDSKTLIFTRDDIAKPAASFGQIRLDGAHVYGNMDFANADLTAKEFANPNYAETDEQIVSNNDTPGDKYVALSGQGLNVDATLSLFGVRAKGCVHLLFAKIGNNLDARYATLFFPGDLALCADAAEINGVVDFGSSHSFGLIRLVQAKIGEGAYFNDARFNLRGKHRLPTKFNDGVDPKYQIDRNLCGIIADGASVGGTFIWKNITIFEPNPASERKVLFVAPGASVTELDDDKESWAKVSRIDLRDCAYNRVTDLSTDISWRIGRLDSEYAPWNLDLPEPLRPIGRPGSVVRLIGRMISVTREIIARARFTFKILGLTWQDKHLDKNTPLGSQVNRFSPSPYLQLARVYHDAGLQQASEQVLLRLERNRTWFGGLGYFNVLWRSLLDAAIGFGSAPFRPIWAVLLPWTLVSWYLFDQFHRSSVMGGPSGEATGQICSWQGTLKEICTLTVQTSGTPAPLDEPRFSGLFYALDSLIPFVDFDQRKTFPILNMMSWAGALLAFNTFLGYAAASFLAAGLSGLAKLGKDGDAGS